MANRHTTGPQVSPPPWQPRFGIGTLLLVMMIVSVMGAAASYFARALQGERSAQFAFVLFTIAAPLLLVVVVSLAQRLFGKRKEPTKSEFFPHLRQSATWFRGTPIAHRRVVPSNRQILSR